MKDAKLIDEINLALREDSVSAVASILGPRYSQLRVEVNNRLAKCIEHIRSKNEVAALQEAQFAPPLLDLVELLSFPKVNQWETFLKENGIEIGPRFDAKHLEMIGSLYTKRIDGSDPLYKDLAFAMRTKDFQNALLYLRLIRQKNPDDTNAKEQLQKVEKRIQSEKLEIIGKLVEQKDEDEFLVFMNSFESEPWENQPEGSILVGAKQYLQKIEQKSALLQCQENIKKIHEFFDSKDWRSAIPFLSSIKQLVSNHGLSLNQNYEDGSEKSFQSQLDLFENWIVNETTIERKKREDESRLNRLKTLLDQIDDNKLSASRRVPELRTDLIKLNVIVREIETAKQDLGKKELAQVKEAQNNLNNSIRKKKNKVRFLVGLASVVVISVGVGCFLFVFESLERKEELNLLNRGMLKYSNVLELEDFIDDFEKNYQQRTNDVEFSALIKKGRANIENELTMLTNFQNRMELFEQSLAKVDQVDDLSKLNLDRSSLKLSVSKLNIAFRPIQLDRMEQSDIAWDKRRDQLQVEISKSLNADLDGIREFSDENVNSKQITSVLRGKLHLLNGKLVALENQLSQLSGIEGLGLSSAQEDLLNSIRQNYKKCKEDLNSFDQAILKLDDANSTRSYFNALKSLTALPFSNERIVNNSKTILSRGSLVINMPATVFLPKNPSLWKSAPKQINSSYKPTTLVKSEIDILKKIFVEKRLQKVMANQFAVLKNSAMEKDIGGWKVSNKQNQTRIIYSIGSPEDPIVEFKSSTSYGSYLMKQNVLQIFANGTERTSYKSEWRGVNRDLKKVGNGGVFVTGDLLMGGKFFEEHSHLSKESKYIFGEGKDGGVVINMFEIPKVKIPLLKFLDDLQGAEINVLIKAFIQINMVETMKVRPGEWGLANNPGGTISVLQDQEKLKSIVGEQDLVSEWYKFLSSNENEKKSALHINLVKFYTRSAGSSYYKEVRFFEKFWKELLKSDFTYKGYCKPDDTWSIPKNISSWGLYKDTSRISVVRSGGKEATPLSPIYSFDLDIAKLLEDARKFAYFTGVDDTDYLRVKKLLPYPFPLFPEK